jgi:hypothetical protein
LKRASAKLTASRVACLMTADEAKILNLWREMIRDPHYVPDDLSGVWPVQLGTVTEALNLRWFEREHGAVSRIGEVVTMTVADDWAAATLDGWSDRYLCPVECKHCRRPRKPRHHHRALSAADALADDVTDARQCALSVIMGANEPIVE